MDKRGKKEGMKKGEGIKEGSSIGTRLHPTELLKGGDVNETQRDLDIQNEKKIKSHTAKHKLRELD